MQEEKSFTNMFLESILQSLPYLKPIYIFVSFIMNTIPRMFKKVDTLSIKFLYDLIELISIVISLIIINYSKEINAAVNKSNIKNSTELNVQTTPIESGLLSLTTTKSIFYVIFIILLILNLIHITYLYVNKTEMTGILGIIKNIIYDVPLYLIVFLFSFVIFILTNFLTWISDFINNLFALIIHIYNELIEIFKDRERATTFVKYLFLYIVIISIIFSFFNIVNDSNALNKNSFIYAFFIIIPLVIVLYYSTPFSSGQSSSVNILITLLIVLFFSIITYYYFKLNDSSSLIVNYISSIIIIAIVILGLANIFYILGNYFRSFTGWTGFIVNFIFYIPCLLIDFIKYILNELKMTTNPIYVILFLELIVILLYIYLPSLFKMINITNSVVLLPGSSFLNQKNTISNSIIHQHTLPTPVDENIYFSSVIRGQNSFTNWFNLNINNLLKKSENIDNNIFNQTYAFSMWIYLNAQSTNNSNEIEIFSFGIDNDIINNSREGKPRITFYNDSSLDKHHGKTTRDLIRVYFTNQTNPKGYYDFKILKQKWNNIVMNITMSKADLFVNGELEYTYYYQNNHPIHNPVDFITTGQHNGLNGAICNIIYYPRNLSFIEITNNYNLLMLKNPPIY